MLIMMFFLYLLISAVFAGIVYAIGHISLAGMSQETYNGTKLLALKLTTGSLLLVCITSIIVTSGKTMYSGLLIFLLVVFYNVHKTQLAHIKQNLIKIEIKEIVYFLLVLSVVGLVFQFLFRLQNISIEGLSDYSFYSAVTESLFRNGIESGRLFVNMPGNKLPVTPEFYHYFSFWLGGIVSNIFTITNFNAFVYVVEPLCVSLSVIMARTLMIKYGFSKISIASFVLPFLLIILSSNSELFNTLLPSSHLKFSPTYYFYYYSIKLSLVYIGIFWVLVCFEKDIEDVIIPLSILCFVYPTTLPVIVSAVLVVLIIIGVVNKTFKLSLFLKTIFPLLFIAIFYALQHTSTAKTGIGILPFVLQKIASYSLVDLKQIIGDLFFFYGPYVLFGIPLIIIVKTLKITDVIFHPLFLLFSTIFILSSILHSLTFGIWDADQLQKNICYSLFNVLAFVSVIMLFKSHKILIFSSLVIVNVLSVTKFIIENKQYVSNKSNAEMSLLCSEFDQSNFTSAYMYNYSRYKKSDVYKIFECYVPFPEIRRYTNSYFPVCMSVYEILQIDTKGFKYNEQIQVSPFYQFVGDTTGKSLDSLKIAYLKKYKIDYLFLEKGNTFVTQLDKLPIEKTIRFANASCDIIKFNWK